jgi:hypothetical protein
MDFDDLPQRFRTWRKGLAAIDVMRAVGLEPQLTPRLGMLEVRVAGVPELGRFAELFDRWGQAVREWMPGAAAVFEALAREARSERLIQEFFGSYIPPQVLVFRVPALRDTELQLLAGHFREVKAGWPVSSSSIRRMFGDLAAAFSVASDRLGPRGG